MERDELLTAPLQGRYRITAQLGEGGMGAVYRAWDLRLDRPVAIKANTLAQSGSAQQFEREAKVLARLRHPHLPAVIDHFVQPDGSQYLVMELIEGEDLQEILDRHGPFDEAQAISWIEQICHAVHYLHQQKPPIIHRDIKPKNIKITPEGELFLVDFGIAKVGDAEVATSLGAQGLTPGFSPPEQYGRGGTDARSDVYALGATLYVLLTGQVPVESVQRTIQAATLTPPRALRPDLSPGVAQAVEAALQTTPTDRPQSVAAFRMMLLRSVPAHSGAGAVSPAPTPQNAWWQRIPAWGWGIAGIGLIAVVAFLLLNSPFGLLASDPIATATLPVKPMETPLATTPTLAAIAKVTPIPTETEVQPSATPAPISTPTQAGPVAASPTATPTPASGGRVTFVSKRDGNHEIYVVDVDGSNLQRLTYTDADEYYPAWSPDGSQIAFHSNRDGNDEIYVMNDDGSNPRRLTFNETGDYEPAWSPDGRYIAFSSERTGKSDLYIIGVDGTGLQQITSAAAGEWSQTWSPNGQQLVFYSDRDGDIELYRVDLDGTGLRRLTNHPGQDNFPDWSPDGQYIAFKSDRSDAGRIWLMAPDGTGLRMLMSGTHYQDYPAWSPSGSSLTFMSARDGNGEIYTVNLDGTDLRRLTYSSAQDLHPDWGP